MKKITRLFGLGFLSIAALGSFTSCEKTGFKVGLLCLHGQSSTYDNNFITAFEKACEANGLSKNEYSIKTDVAEDYNRIYTAAKEWAEDGYSLVCADSFGHQYGMLPVAKEYPNTEFCHATGDLASSNKDVKNFHNAFASIYKGRFLAGIVAGYTLAEDERIKSPSDCVIGYVGAMPYAEVISGYTSFYLGTKYGLKEANRSDLADALQMKVKYTSSWYDYKAEKETAEYLIKKEGCKLISQHADSMGAPIACKELHTPNICYNVETNESCPNTFLVASRINWFNYFDLAISVAREKYEARKTGNQSTREIPNDYCGNLDISKPNSDVDLCKDDNNKIVYGKNVKDDVKSKVEEVAAKLSADSLQVFDTSTFTVTKDETRNKDAKITLDENKHLKTYTPEYLNKDVIASKVDGDGKTIYYVNESYIDESDDNNSFRSAPYFDLIIDGIDILKNN